MREREEKHLQGRSQQNLRVTPGDSGWEERRNRELKWGRGGGYLLLLLICLGAFAVLHENAQGGKKKESYFDLQKRGKVIRKT